jgi:Cu+-exporting ATPase
LSQNRGAPKRAVFSVSNFDCATCASAVEKRLNRLEGVAGVRTSVMLNQIFVDYYESMVGIPEITEAIKETGYAKYLTRKLEH